MSVPGTVIYFTSYDRLRAIMDNEAYGASVAGASARGLFSTSDV